MKTNSRKNIFYFQHFFPQPTSELEPFIFTGADLGYFNAIHNYTSNTVLFIVLGPGNPLNIYGKRYPIYLILSLTFTGIEMPFWEAWTLWSFQECLS